MPRSDRQLIAHLLRRTGFGATSKDVDAYTSLGFEGAVDRLINYEAIDDHELEATIAQMRADNPTAAQPDRPEIGNPGLEVAIWLTRMLMTRRPLQEKMALFWHGHFTSSILDVKRADLMRRQNDLYRANALTTNLKEFTRAVAHDPAMLIYLDNNTNRKGKPNENWARELFELFTLGIGNYTETDVKEAARAFTGWTVNRQGEFAFNPRQHDDPKTVLGVTGNLNGDDIINIIFTQPVHGKFMARKLFRFFVHDTPDEATVNRFADIYVKSGFNVKELVRQLLLSPEFRSDQAYFAMIKSPAEYTIGALRALSARFPDLKAWLGINSAMKVMGQQIFAPPDVSGWAGNKSWINSTTYYSRANLAAQLVSVESEATIDPAEIASSAGVTTPNAAVDYFLELLLQSDVPASYKSTLQTFMGATTPNTPRLWNGKLRGLVRLIMSSPAYQMH
ncbi:MAG TPA: DUF1800 domain-containing protein [Chloroflexia bacterium]|jgi:uncharacterized protein (DUF1800 family)